MSTVSQQLIRSHWGMETPSPTPQRSSSTTTPFSKDASAVSRSRSPGGSLLFGILAPACSADEIAAPMPGKSIYCLSVALLFVLLGYKGYRSRFVLWVEEIKGFYSIRTSSSTLLPNYFSFFLQLKLVFCRHDDHGGLPPRLQSPIRLSLLQLESADQ